MINLDEAIKRYEKHSKCINQTLITKEEAESVHELLRELKAYENIIFEITEAMDCYDGCEKAQGFREYPTNDFIDDVRKCVEQFEEVNADKGVLEKINEKQDSLRATCKAWDEAIEKDGYVD